MLDLEELKSHVLEEYLVWVDDICDACEDKTRFEPDEIVYKVVDIVMEKLDL